MTHQVPFGDMWRDVLVTAGPQWRQFASDMNLNELQQRVVLNGRRGAKVVEGTDWLLIMLAMPHVKRHVFSTDRIVVLINKTQAITAHTAEFDEEVLQKIQVHGAIARTPSTILAVLANVIVEQYEEVLDDVDDTIDRLEDTMINNPRQEALEELFTNKRILADMRRSVLPLMSVLDSLSNGRYSQLDTKNAAFLRDSYDFVWRIHELIDTMRDLLSSALDTYLSVVSNKLNDVMKRLTLVTTIFMPISFVVGFGGMNFVQMPFHSMGWFIVCLASLIIMPIAMIYYFKVKKWL